MCVGYSRLLLHSKADVKSKYECYGSCKLISQIIISNRNYQILVNTSMKVKCTLKERCLTAPFPKYYIRQEAYLSCGTGAWFFTISVLVVFVQPLLCL